MTYRLRQTMHIQCVHISYCEKADRVLHGLDGVRDFHIFVDGLADHETDDKEGRPAELTAWRNGPSRRAGRVANATTRGR